MYRVFTHPTFVTNLDYLTVGDSCDSDNCLSVHRKPLQCIPAIFFSIVSLAMFSVSYDILVFFTLPHCCPKAMLDP